MPRPLQRLRPLAAFVLGLLGSNLVGASPLATNLGKPALAASPGTPARDHSSAERRIDALFPAAACPAARAGSVALPALQTDLLARRFDAFQPLAEEALAMRAAAIRLLRELKAKTARNAPLSGADLKALNAGAAAMLAQRADLFRVSHAHECWLGAAIPGDADAAAAQAKGVALSLAAALLLYDNYLSTVALYRSDDGLRRHLNRADRGYGLPGGELDRIAASFASPSNRARVRRGIAWFDKHGSAMTARGDDDARYLAKLIEQSPSRQLVRRARPFEFAGNLAGLFATLTLDGFRGLTSEGTHVSSLLFGNAVGLVETRRGKLDARTAVETQVRAALQPGDILLEKTPFRLTDAFIPGHWGHVAIWVGSEAELRELGVWDDPAVRPHHAAIRAGRGVVEALRSGVEMNSLGHFLNVDDLAVLRERDPSPERRRDIVRQTLRQVGKGYDFNFNVESTDRIVCSELAYHAYAHLSWPTSRVLGRATISPDNVAARGLAGEPLDIVLLYHDGRALPADAATLARFVEPDVVRVATRRAD